MIDTSSLNPLGQFENRSKLNIAHALVVRDVCCALQRSGCLSNITDVGVIAPYRPQVSLIEDLLDEAGMSEIAVGTAHRFQGAERDTIVFDLTESDPHKIGTFLGPVSIREAGAKLLNVSLSRAQIRLVVVGNLSYLRSNLNDQHILHGILDDLQRLGTVVDVREVVPDALSGRGESTAESQASQRFDAETFLAGFTADVREAASSVLISSSRLSSRVAHILATIVKPQLEKGISVDVVCPTEALAEGEEDGRLAKTVLEGAGVRVHAISEAADNAVVVDRQIVWIGNTPPLDCMDRSDLLMTRAVSPVAAQMVCGCMRASQDTPLSVSLAANS